MKTNICRLMGWGVVAAAVSSVSLTGCQDFFEQESDHIIFADGDHLNNPTDTVYSMMGILQKMQAIADRSVLLGEVRGDLVMSTNTLRPTFAISPCSNWTTVPMCTTNLATITPSSTTVTITSLVPTRR